MSTPSPELVFEVNIFEQLERSTPLTLGQLTELRQQSRVQQRNLLFVVFDQGLINIPTAEQIARMLQIDTTRAPWPAQSFHHGPSPAERTYDANINQSLAGTSPQPLVSSHAHVASHATRSPFSSQVEDPSVSQSGHQATMTHEPHQETPQRRRSGRGFRDRPSLTEAVDRAVSLHDSPRESPRAMSHHSGSIDRATFNSSLNSHEEGLKQDSSLERSSLNGTLTSPPHPDPQRSSSAQDLSEGPVSGPLSEGDPAQSSTAEGSSTVDSSPPSPQPIHTKRSFANVNPKTEIEIELPASIEYFSQSSSGSRLRAEALKAPSAAPYPRATPHPHSMRWSPRAPSVRRDHLGETIYTRRCFDGLLRREVNVVSSHELSDDELLSRLSPVGGARSRFIMDTSEGLPHDQLNLHDRIGASLTLRDRLSRNHVAMTPLMYDVLQVADEPPRYYISDVDRGVELSGGLLGQLNTPQMTNTRAQRIAWQLMVNVRLAHLHGVAHLAISPFALRDHGALLSLSDWMWCHEISQAPLSGQQASPRVPPPSVSPTPHEVWVAPELRVIDSERLTALNLKRADLYSVASTLFWLFTDQAPITEELIFNVEGLMLERGYSLRFASVLSAQLITALSPHPNQRDVPIDELMSAYAEGLESQSLLEVARQLGQSSDVYSAQLSRGS